MKKRLVIVTVLLALFPILLIGCEMESKKEPYNSLNKEPEYITDKKLKPAEDILTCSVTSYHMNLKLDTNKKNLSGNVVMKLTNETNEILDKICIRNYAASILEEEGKGASYIKSVVIEGTDERLSLDIKKDPSVVYVDLSKNKLEPKQSVSLKVDFTTDIPNKQDRFGYVSKKKGDIFQLSFCFPIIAMYEDGKWNENPYVSVGESSYNKVTDYYVTLETPEDYTVVASGEEETKGNITVIKGENIRDMAIVVSNYMKVETKTINGVEINNYFLDYNNMEDYNEFSMMAAEDSIKLFSDSFGKYPYSELDVVQTYIRSATEYPGLVMIGLPDVGGIGEIQQSASYQDLCSSVAHEVAHQWFYATVGNDQYIEPWLDESFAEYCEDILYFYSGMESIVKSTESDIKRIGLEENFTEQSEEEIAVDIEMFSDQENIAINKPYNEYDNENNDYSYYVYEGGANFFYELRKSMGDGLFFYMMREYYNSYYLKEAKGSNFLDAIRTFDNSEQTEKVIEKYIKES